MAKATILTVDDDPAVVAAVARDLRSRYGKDYRIMHATSGAEALELLGELALRGQAVALIASDQRMPEMTGIEFLEQALVHAPDAKLVLLTAYADTDAAIRAINDIGLDHYLMKPWDPPEERLYPVLDDLLEAWGRDHPAPSDRLRVIGHRWSERSHEIKMFLARNHVPYEWIDVERDAGAARLLELADADAGDLPVVVSPNGGALRAPSNREVADALGLRTTPQQPLYDLCIVGAGPAGLAAGVYAASEGLQTVVIEREAPGGQAAQSSRIENYLGFPKGLSGADLTQRAVAQAERFGAEIVRASDVTGFEARGPVRAVLLDGEAIEARAVLVATGVSYRMLEAEGGERVTGRGLYYGASVSDVRAIEGDDVFIVGAANSAGQAALNLATRARRVVLLVRGDDLGKSMSQYLVDRVDQTPNIEVRTTCEVVRVDGDDHLERVTVADRTSGTESVHATNWLFVFIGAAPRTAWLGDDIVRDDKGFVITGADLCVGGVPNIPSWPLARLPFALESSVPGVFAAGDVRLDSMKRVASAVGEGAMAVHFVHRYLATI